MELTTQLTEEQPPESEKTKAIRALQDKLQDVSADVRKVLAAIEEERQARHTFLAAAKRAVLQFLNLIGWVK